MEKIQSQTEKQPELRRPGSKRSSRAALAVKDPPTDAADVRDRSSIPGSGRSPGRGNGSPLQCSCLENPSDRRAWWNSAQAVTGVKQNQQLNHCQQQALCGEHGPICNSPTPSTCRSFEEHFVRGAVCLSHDGIPWVSNSCSGQRSQTPVLPEARQVGANEPGRLGEPAENRRACHLTERLPCRELHWGSWTFWVLMKVQQSQCC